MPIYKKIAQKIPGLELKLIQAKIPDTAEDYVKRTVVMSGFLGLVITFIFFSFTKNFLFILFFPIIFFFSFTYMIRYADVTIERVKKEVSKEIIYAGRFLIIEIESGVPIYDAFRNIAKNYETTGKYFGEIVQEVNFGTSLEDALNDAIIHTPSPELRKILWQVLNSMKTGADITMSLNAVIDQIVREQQIGVKEYSRKLNPIAMFYMMVAIIIPSLGTTMLVVLATFMGLEVPFIAFFVLAVVIGFMQAMFLAFIKSNRPPMAI